MMTMTRAAILAIAMAMPVAMHAQRGAAPRGPRAGGNPVAPLIDMRRELNLSTRQLTQLDSIERSLLQRNEGVRARLRTRLDSIPRRGRQLTEDERQALRGQADSLRALRRTIVRNDSVARSAAMSVLTDSQRVKVRERLAERRGFIAGRMSAQRGGARGFRQGGPGAGGGRMGPGMPGGRMGMGGQGVRPGMRGPGGVGPGRGFQGRRPPVGEFGPMGGEFRRRMGPPDEQVAPDGQGPMLRRRGMIDGGAPDQAPPRRPPADSGR